MLLRPPFFPLPFADIPGPLLLGPLTLLLLFLGVWRPLRRARFSLSERVIRNFVFAAPGLLLLRLLLIPVPYAASLWAQRHGVGALNVALAHLPAWMEALIGIMAFDYAYYWWHMATHHVPFLYRFHFIHHADLDMDVSTAARFHFGDIFLSVPFRVGVVLVTGIAPMALLAFELCFECATTFHHSNWRLPARVDAALSRVFITPRLHGLHHAEDVVLFNSNWGTIFSLWDQLHRSRIWREAQEPIGVPERKLVREQTLGEMWRGPFQR